MKKSVPIAMALLASLSLPALADGDPEKGKVFNKCKACHVAKASNKVGPTLKA